MSSQALASVRLGGDVEQRPPGDGDHSRTRERAGEVVAHVVNEAWNRTQPRSARKVAELLYEMGFRGRHGEAYSESAVRAWAIQRDRPAADVVIALALAHDISIDEQLWGMGMKQELRELKSLVLQIARQIDFPMGKGLEVTGSGSSVP